MSDPGQAARWIRIACWMVGGIALGAITGEITDSVKRPEVKRPRAAEILVAAGDRPGEETRLSSTHAAIVLRSFFLHPLPDKIRDQPEKLIKHVRIQAEKDGTRITVDVPEIDENRGLAREIARIYRGVAREKEVAAVPVDIPPFSPQDRKLAIDARKLKGLLHDQAARAGYVDFLQILPKAVNGSAKAKTVVEDEDFSRRFRRYEELSVSLGLEGVPGAPLTSAPDVIFEARFVDENREPEKRNSKANLISMSCVLLAGAGAWLTNRRKASGDPGWAQENSAPLAGDVP
ncbi:hypothetical protein OVA24_19875 [Luteolibacter sp. SL250]|uniref:hypothetical protein n=1 Tax=Luteolibacter sp. SL250 TaxID=2995170 RepID=UPI00226EDF77|nr:hypothetical protein [Luteolibacter sp. SL250]WAC19487.1 hypothetical protein OVA24_19875 [Luteolibacter sp. SL250]